MKIILNIVPPTATAQQKGAYVAGGRVRFYKKEKVRIAENLLASMLKDYQPKEPINEAVNVSVVFCFPYRKNERKHIVRNGLIVPHTTRPDLDNMEKALLDTLTRLGFWNDDALVCSKHTRKQRGPVPFIRIDIVPLKELLP
ncbi:MAG: RusA family crossover junction endodeoxyribonuclease [Kiritimatiellia bacterium]